MLGQITVVQDDKKAIFVQFDQPADFKIGEQVDITQHKNKRSLQQNKLYFAFLKWCISREGGGLIDQGHWSVDGLHSDIKAWV